jgi:hypothetical protein
VRESTTGRWAARIAVTMASGALLLLAVPAHAAPSGQPSKPRASHAQQQGIPIDLHVGGLRVHIVVPLNLGILGGPSSSPESAPTTSAPAASTPPVTSHHPSPPGKTHQHPPTSRATHARPPTASSQAAVPLVAATHRAGRHTRPAHRPTHVTKHHSKASPVRHHDIAAGLVSNPPLPGANVAALLAVIAVFGIGVLGIVLAAGRRTQPEAKHRR